VKFYAINVSSFLPPLWGHWRYFESLQKCRFMLWKLEYIIECRQCIYFNTNIVLQQNAALTLDPVLSNGIYQLNIKTVFTDILMCILWCNICTIHKPCWSHFIHKRKIKLEATSTRTCWTRKAFFWSCFFASSFIFSSPFLLLFKSL